MKTYDVLYTHAYLKVCEGGNSNKMTLVDGMKSYTDIILFCASFSACLKFVFCGVGICTLS